MSNINLLKRSTISNELSDTSELLQPLESIDEIKRRIKREARQAEVRHLTALNDFSRKHGFSGWKEFVENEKKKRLSFSFKIFDFDVNANRFPVFCHYAHQLSEQPAFIVFDLCNKELSASFNPQIGGADHPSVFHGTVLKFRIPENSEASLINKLFKNPEFLVLAQTLFDGFEERYDGSNFTGYLDSKALDAVDTISSLIEQHFEDPQNGWSLTDPYSFIDGENLIKFWIDSGELNSEHMSNYISKLALRDQVWIDQKTISIKSWISQIISEELYELCSAEGPSCEFYPDNCQIPFSLIRAFYNLLDDQVREAIKDHLP